MGGKDTPGLGFGLGIERLMMILDSIGAPMPDDEKCFLYIAAMDDKSRTVAGKICAAMRESGFEALYDLCGRSLKRR